MHKDLDLAEDDEAVIDALATITGDSPGMPCDPASIARALMSKARFTTGFIPDDIIYHEQVGVKQTVVGYRNRQKTGIWLEGSVKALRIPLPHLILIRTTYDGKKPDYKLFACAKRPEALTDPLYRAPLPNVFSSGGICWGSVSRPKADSISLKADWEALLGSRFGNHACAGKCQSHPKDVRNMLLELNENPNRRVYPKRELVEAKTTLADILDVDLEETS